MKIRIYYALAQYMKEHRLSFDGTGYDRVEALCFDTIQKTIFDDAASRLSAVKDYRIACDRVDVELPVRVNWGGGWTDTPPHCNERGGTVLNAALKLNGIYPIQILGREAFGTPCGICQHGHRRIRAGGQRGGDPGLPQSLRSLCPA